jgi:hypothetical protein
MAVNRPNGSKIDQPAIKYTNIFHCKTLQNLPKSGFLVRKYTIWQPGEVSGEDFFQLNFDKKKSHDWLPGLAHPEMSSYGNDETFHLAESF